MCYRRHRHLAIFGNGLICKSKIEFICFIRFTIIKNIHISEISMYEQELFIVNTYKYV